MSRLRSMNIESLRNVIYPQLKELDARVHGMKLALQNRQFEALYETMMHLSEITTPLGDSVMVLWMKVSEERRGVARGKTASRRGVRR